VNRYGRPSKIELPSWQISLVVDRESVPACLEVSATTPDGIIMGLRHRELLCEGVQFHPESIMTAHGKQLLENFLHKSGTGPLFL
jgi:anthranilate/para-aminobenzoate synthase component II